jgi:uncharacterized protein YxjI
MRYVMKQRVLALTDSFTIRNSDGDKAYRVKGKLLSVGDRLIVRDAEGKKVATIRQKVVSMMPRYRIRRNGKLVAVVNKKMFSVLRDRFKVKMKDGSPDLEIVGSVLDHEYRFLRRGNEVARVSKKWLSVGDSYGVKVDKGEDDVLILACAAIIDLICHDEETRPYQVEE